MTKLKEALKPFSQANFRELYRRFIYIDCKELMETMLPKAINSSITGMLVYCYIDNTEGISFRPFMIASLGDDSLRTFEFPNLEDTMYVLRLREGQVKLHELHEDNKHMYLYAVDPKKYSYMNLEILNFDTDAFSQIKKVVDTNYHVSAMVDDLRSERFAYLDEYRHPLFPDDVQVLLYTENNGFELVWVRLNFVTPSGEIFGRLLIEPHKDYGCHKDMLIEITEAVDGEEKALVFTGRVASRKQ